MTKKQSPKKDQEAHLKTLSFLGIILIIITTLFSSEAIMRYCELFFELGAAARERFLENPLMAFLATPILFWVSAYICRKFANNAAGNTNAHIESSLYRFNKTPNSFGKITATLNFRSVMTSAISSLISTFGGGALGREAPSVYMSVGIFAAVSRKIKKFIPNISLETWICAGTAAGFAIAFHSPIAGLIYVIEKLFRSQTKIFFDDITWAATALFVVIIVLNQTRPLFAVEDLKLWFGKEMLLIALIASVSGFISFFFKKAAIASYDKLAKIKSNWWHLVPICTGFLVSITSFFGGVNSFSGGIKTAQDALGGNELTCAEVGARIINTILTFASGCAGGLVAPAIAIGAGIGSIFSNLMQTIDAKIFILSGMTAFLVPILSTPFATAMVILETSNQPILAFPFLLFSSIISLFTTTLISKITK